MLQLTCVTGAGGGEESQAGWLEAADKAAGAGHQRAAFGPLGLGHGMSEYEGGNAMVFAPSCLHAQQMVNQAETGRPWIVHCMSDITCDKGNQACNPQTYSTQLRPEDNHCWKTDR